MTGCTNAKISMATTTDYIKKLRNRMTAHAAEPNYFKKLREYKPGEVKVTTKKEYTAPDDPLVKDIEEAKKDGNTLEDVLNAIDDIEDIKDKEHAKEVAKTVFKEA